MPVHLASDMTCFPTKPSPTIFARFFSMNSMKWLGARFGMFGSRTFFSFLGFLVGGSGAAGGGAGLGPGAAFLAAEAAAASLFSKSSSSSSDELRFPTIDNRLGWVM